MGLSESQLSSWSNQGATQQSASTHQSIRSALGGYNWPSWVRYEDYLSGSYRNSTNIRGNSDVDLVLEVTSFSYSNLTDEQKRVKGISTSPHSLEEFRQVVIQALTQLYGSAAIDTSGRKAIRLKASSGRLDTDIVVSATYKSYEENRLRASGIIFWATDGTKIINYPKVHYDNGATKNKNTGEYFKPSVRMFKNTREAIYQKEPSLRGKFPSYFLECLFYNVPNDSFGSSLQSTYTESVNWLSRTLGSDEAKKLVCQNYQEYLFGPHTTQWDLVYAQSFIRQAIHLWNNS